MVYGGSDVWVNNWLKEAPPHLDHPSKLLIHRRRPENIKVNYDSPIEVAKDTTLVSSKTNSRTQKNTYPTWILHTS